jgi:branched-chain amino acid transport system permease protein
VIEAGLYVLALAGGLTNWWFAILTASLVMLLPVIGQVAMPGAFVEAGELARRRAEVPPELVGIDEPYTEAGRARLDLALGLDGETQRLRSPRPAPGTDRSPEGTPHVPA